MKLIEDIVQWVIWFVVALVAGYAWAASAYLPQIEHLQSRLHDCQVAAPYDATETTPFKYSRKYLTGGGH